MNIDEILEIIARRNNGSLYFIKASIWDLINESIKNSDSKDLIERSKIPCKGEVPYVEGFINYAITWFS